MSDFLDECEQEIENEEDLKRMPVKTLRNTTAWGDDDVMPFGKYKGHPLKDIPASYLLWWADQDSSRYPELLGYILKNKKTLDIEAASFSDNNRDSDYYSNLTIDDDDWGDRF
jgi:uncharacterized protein (DUF3820 family)